MTPHPKRMQLLFTTPPQNRNRNQNWNQNRIKITNQNRNQTPLFGKQGTQFHERGPFHEFLPQRVRRRVRPSVQSCMHPLCSVHRSTNQTAGHIAGVYVAVEVERESSEFADFNASFPWKDLPVMASRHPLVHLYRMQNETQHDVYQDTLKSLVARETGTSWPENVDNLQAQPLQDITRCFEEPKLFHGSDRRAMTSILSDGGISLAYCGNPFPVCIPTLPCYSAFPFRITNLHFQSAFTVWSAFPVCIPTPHSQSAFPVCISQSAFPSGHSHLLSQSDSPIRFPSLHSQSAFLLCIPNLHSQSAFPVCIPICFPTRHSQSASPIGIPSLHSPSAFPVCIPSLHSQSAFPFRIPSLHFRSVFPLCIPSPHPQSQSAIPVRIPSLHSQSAFPNPLPQFAFPLCIPTLHSHSAFPFCIPGQVLSGAAFLMNPQFQLWCCTMTHPFCCSQARMHACTA